MKKYKIKTNDIGMCMSVGCDFYQTCDKNEVSQYYKTKRKFIPVIVDNACISYGSGKNSSIRDNNYPYKLVKYV